MPDPAPADRPDLNRPDLDPPGLDRIDDDPVESRPSDDTVELDAEPSLADDLLHSDEPTEDDGSVTRGGVEQGVPGGSEHGERGELEHGESGADARTPAGLPDRVTDSTDPDEDDEYFEPHHQKRGRVTTGLLVALIFALGMLAGVLVGRLLTPTPAPQIVYVLNDAPSSAPAPTSPAPSASR